MVKSICWTLNFKTDVLLSIGAPVVVVGVTATTDFTAYGTDK